MITNAAVSVRRVSHKNTTFRPAARPRWCQYGIIYSCRRCRRYQRNPKTFGLIEPGSPELFSICLKHIPTLSLGQHQVGEAGWVWTEPHSVRLTTGEQRSQNVQIQQRVVGYCGVQNGVPTAIIEFTNQTWQTMRSVRQETNRHYARKDALEIQRRIMIYEGCFEIWNNQG
jgi:hypothetical protein